MNDLVMKTAREIGTCDRGEIAPQMMVMFRAVTPQFYKNLSDEDIEAERLGIELLIANIEQPCIAKMCELAVLNYPKSRSEDLKVYFDINYVLTFYKQAFNKIYCEDVDLPKGSKYLSGTYDESLHVLTEKYVTPDGEIITLREINEMPKNSRRNYTSKTLDGLYMNLDDIEL